MHLERRRPGRALANGRQPLPKRLFRRIPKGRAATRVAWSGIALSVMDRHFNRRRLSVRLWRDRGSWMLGPRIAIDELPSFSPQALLHRRLPWSTVTSPIASSFGFSRSSARAVRLHFRATAMAPLTWTL